VVLVIIAAPIVIAISDKTGKSLECLCFGCILIAKFVGKTKENVEKELESFGNKLDDMKVEKEKKKVVKEAEKAVKNAEKEELGLLKELFKMQLSDWKSIHVGEWVDSIGFGDFKKKFGIFNGRTLVDSAYFSDSIDSENNLTAIFSSTDAGSTNANVDGDAEKFISAVRFLRAFMDQSKVPKVFLRLKEVEEFLEEHDMEQYLSKVLENKLNMAYLLERTPDELSAAFDETNAMFGKVLWQKLSDWADQHVQNVLLDYRRSITANLKLRNFSTLDGLIAGNEASSLISGVNGGVSQINFEGGSGQLFNPNPSANPVPIIRVVHKSLHTQRKFEKPTTE